MFGDSVAVAEKAGDGGLVHAGRGSAGNLPGVAVIRAAGYGPEAADGGIPISKVITISGLATLLLAPFGAFALNLSAITAAICMGKEAHPEPDKRHTAAVSCGLIYIVIGIFGAAITGLLTAFPK